MQHLRKALGDQSFTTFQLVQGIVAVTTTAIQLVLNGLKGGLSIENATQVGYKTDT